MCGYALVFLSCSVLFVSMWRRIQNNAVRLSLNISSGGRILQLPAFQFERLMLLLLLMFHSVELMQYPDVTYLSPPITFIVPNQYIQVQHPFPLLFYFLVSCYNKEVAVLISPCAFYSDPVLDISLCYSLRVLNDLNQLTKGKWLFGGTWHFFYATSHDGLHHIIWFLRIIWFI